MLGFYDPQREAITLSEREMVDHGLVEAVLMHESTHRDLSEKTIGGFFDRYLATLCNRAHGAPDVDRQIAEDALSQSFARSWLVHEGTATTLSLAVAAGSGEEVFNAMFASLPDEYRRAVTPLLVALGSPLSWAPGSHLVEQRILVNAAKAALIEPYRDLIMTGVIERFSALGDALMQHDPDRAFSTYLDRLSDTSVLRQLNAAALSCYRVEDRNSLPRLLERLSEGASTGAELMQILFTQFQDRISAFDDAVARAITDRPSVSTTELTEILRRFTLRHADALRLADGRPAGQLVTFVTVADNLPTWVGIDTADRVDRFWREVRHTPTSAVAAVELIESTGLLRLPEELVPILHCFIHAGTSVGSEPHKEFWVSIDLRALRAGPFITDPDENGGISVSSGVRLSRPLRFPFKAALEVVDILVSATGANSVWYLEPDLASACIGRESLVDLPGLTLAPIDPADTRVLRELLLTEATLGTVQCRLLPGTQPGASVLSAKRLGALQQGELTRKDGSRALIFTVLLPTVSALETVYKMQATEPRPLSERLRLELRPGECALLQTAAAHFYQMLRTPSSFT